MKLRKAVALRVSNILQEKHKSVYSLEKKIAMSHNTMTALMGEKYDGVNLRTVMQIIRGLDMTPAEFFDDPLFTDEDLELY